MSYRENYVRALACVLVASFALGLSGCKKKEAATEPAPEEPPPPAATPAAATPEPKPVAVATPRPAPATPAPELAPPGIFYLVTAVSVETSDGILGLKPGQILREVRPGVYRVENNELTLRPDQVTNDLAIARRLAAQDQQSQAAIQQRLAVQPTAPVSSGVNSPAPPAAQPSALREDPKAAARNELIRQKQVLAVQVNQVTTQLNALSNRYGSWDIAAKKSPQAFQLLQQFNALQKQQADLDAQIIGIH